MLCLHFTETGAQIGDNERLLITYLLIKMIFMLNEINAFNEYRRFLGNIQKFY